MKQLIYFLLIILMMVSTANAKVILEPLVGHNFGGKAKIHGNGSGDYTGINGLGYGGRISYQKLGFSVAADYLHSNLDLHDNDFSRKLNTNEFAGLVGFRFPILLKVYGGYVFSANGSGSYHQGATPNQSLKLNSGHGLKVGVGWTLLPLLDLNLEYRNLQFDDYKLGGVKSTSNTDFSSWMLSVSLPISIME